MINKNFKLNEEQKRFILSIKAGYRSRSFIRDITKHKSYNLDKDSEKPFIQITDGILMDPFDFRDNVDNSPLGNQIGENIAFGEISYLTKTLNESIEPIKKSVLKYSTLLNELNNLPINFKPKFLLVPINHYIEFMKEFERDAIFKYNNRETKVIIGSHNLKIYWSNRYMDYKEIYLLGEEAIELIFKKSNEMKNIESGKVCYFYYDEKDDEIDIFYGLTPEHKIHFGARVVIYPITNKEKVRIYKK